MTVPFLLLKNDSLFLLILEDGLMMMGIKCCVAKVTKQHFKNVISSVSKLFSIIWGKDGKGQTLSYLEQTYIQKDAYTLPTPTKPRQLYQLKIYLI